MCSIENRGAMCEVGPKSGIPTMENDNPGTCLWHVMGMDPQNNSPSGAGRKVLKALKNNKIVNEVNILWRLVAVGNG